MNVSTISILSSSGTLSLVVNILLIRSCESIDILDHSGIADWFMMQYGVFMGFSKKLKLSFFLVDDEDEDDSIQSCVSSVGSLPLV